MGGSSSGGGAPHLATVAVGVRLLVPWRRYEFHVYAAYCILMQRVRILMSALNWAWSNNCTGGEGRHAGRQSVAGSREENGLVSIARYDEFQAQDLDSD